LSNDLNGNLIFKYPENDFEISFEEIYNIWNKRFKKQKILLFICDSLNSW
jgi:hypothetical protein